MSDSLKDNVRAGKTWKRALYMLLFAIIYGVAEIVLTLIILLQFLTLLFTGKTNERMLKLGQSLSTYIYQILLFLTFNSETHPYPYGAWPKGAPPADRRRKKVEPEEGEESSARDIQKEESKKETS